MEPRLSRAVAVALEIRDDDWDRRREGVESNKLSKPPLVQVTGTNLLGHTESINVLHKTTLNIIF